MISQKNYGNMYNFFVSRVKDNENIERNVIPRGILRDGRPLSCPNFAVKIFLYRSVFFLCHHK